MKKILDIIFISENNSLDFLIIQHLLIVFGEKSSYRSLDLSNYVIFVWDLWVVNIAKNQCF